MAPPNMWPLRHHRAGRHQRVESSQHLFVVVSCCEHEALTHGTTDHASGRSADTRTPRATTIIQTLLVTRQVVMLVVGGHSLLCCSPRPPRRTAGRCAAQASGPRAATAAAEPAPRAWTGDLLTKSSLPLLPDGARFFLLRIIIYSLSSSREQSISYYIIIIISPLGTPNYESIDRLPQSVVLTSVIRKLLVREVGKDTDSRPYWDFAALMTPVR